MTDALKTISENTAKQVGGSMIAQRYYDIIDRNKSEKEEKSAEEIIDNNRYKLSMLG